MPDEVFWQLRFEPARWTAEKQHVVKVYVGTDGLHQDEFLRGDPPVTLFRGSIATPSLEAAVINAKYVNINLLDRIARDFQTNGINLSIQTMSNWTVWSAERYFLPVYDLMKKRQLEAHVNQCDETPLEVFHDGRPAGSKSYKRVHLTGELSPGPKIVVYEYQKTRHSDHPKEYYHLEPVCPALGLIAGCRVFCSNFVFLIPLTNKLPAISLSSNFWFLYGL